MLATTAQPLLLLAAMRVLQDNDAELVPAALSPNPLVEARPSSLHGTGLFAIEAMPEGTVAALYPVDALGVDDKETGSVMSSESSSISGDDDDEPPCEFVCECL